MRNFKFLQPSSLVDLGCSKFQNPHGRNTCLQTRCLHWLRLPLGLLRPSALLCFRRFMTFGSSKHKKTEFRTTLICAGPIKPRDSQCSHSASALRRPGSLPQLLLARSLFPRMRNQANHNHMDYPNHRAYL